MLGIPFETLSDDDGAFLGDRYSVSYISSADIFAHLRLKSEGPHGGPGKVLLVGDPPFKAAHLAEVRFEDGWFDRSQADSSDIWELTLRAAAAGNETALGKLPRLAGSRKEIESIEALAPSATVLLGVDASEQNVVGLMESDKLPDYSVIHFATHAFANVDRPEKSAVVLSQVDLPDAFDAAMTGERIYDGLVTAREITREWDIDADLVTLSACETGLGKEIGGEGYVGLAYAFLQAGARGLLVSLWRVDDRATALLMRRFYENWWGLRSEVAAGGVAPMSKVDALQEAKKWLREYKDESGKAPYAHPCYWSAFVLIGDPQ
jgi:CHAT domain-containing protein